MPGRPRRPPSKQLSVVGAQPLRARVTSHTRGRLRVRISQDDRGNGGAHDAGARLEKALGSDRVQVTSATGSVLVHYDPERHSSSDIMGLLKDVGIIIEDTVRELDADVPAGAASMAGDRVVRAMADLDRRLGAMTGHKIDLKALFPLTLGALGVWRVARSGLGVGEVPAYVLLWYAFDSFWKFHSTGQAHSTRPAAAERARGDDEHT